MAGVWKASSLLVVVPALVERKERVLTVKGLRGQNLILCGRSCGCSEFTGLMLGQWEPRY